MTITREEIDEIVNALAVPPGDNGRVSLPGDGMKRLFEIAGHAIYEQSRIDAAVAKERERCAGIADKYAAFAGLADSHIAEVAEDSMREIAREIAAAIRTPTPTTEEGA